MSELLSELLDRCRAGDASAAETLVHRFYGYALSLASSLVNDAHLAEDVAQSAMLTMHQRLHALRDPAAFAGWLRQIVRTEANRGRRGQASQMHLPDNRPSSTESPLQHAQLQELRQRVRDAIASLSAANRQTAELFYLDERNQLQIARQLDVPVGTVKRRLFDARGKLRKSLGRLPL